MGKRKWNMISMNKHCFDNNLGYEVLGVEWIDKKYQKQLWATVKCDNINHEPYLIWWNNFINGYRCKECDYDKKNKEIWNKDKVKKFYLKYGLNINTDDFKNVDTCIVGIDKDGFRHYKSITSLKQGGIGKALFTPNNKDVSLHNINHYMKLYASDYGIFIDEYRGVKELYLFEYLGSIFPNDVDRKFQTTIDSFVNGGVRHPYFSNSNGENKLKEILDNNQIEHTEQKIFKDLKYKNVLRFDFYLPNYNCCIEVDGLQHEKPIEYFGGIKAFKELKKRDELKDKYCDKNNILLIRIKYTTNKMIEFENECIHKIREILKKGVY